MSVDFKSIQIPTKKGVIDINKPNLTIGEIVSAIIPLIFYLSGFALFLMLIVGGFQFLTSAGDKNALEAAKKRITNSLIGFIIIFASYWIVQLVGKILGIKIFSQIFNF